MKTAAKLALSIATFALLLGSARAELKWTEDLDAALTQAKTSGKKVLVDFTGSDWCPYCIKLDNEVLATDAFRQWADKDLILVELDFPRKKEQSAGLKARNKALREKYEVPGYPTVLLLNGDGKILHSEIGYEPGSGDTWLETMKKAATGSAG